MAHRVFLSSTFVDLIEYRKAAQVAIRQLGAIDVSMEHFGARDDRPSDECIRLVKKESDIFVGIYAHRYGHIPDGSMISICEMEYIAASDAKLPRFVYVVDDGQPWLPAYIDVGSDAEQLRRFKDHLSKSHICQKFGNFDHLATRVAADLGRHIAMVDREKVGRDIPVQDIGVNSLRPIDLEAFGAGAPSKGEDSPEEWNKLRNGIYKHNRNVFLAHHLRPSVQKGQLFDVYIYLVRHKSEDFSDILFAEFFLGPYWGNKVFPSIVERGYIGISTAAYGTFLCVCKVTFRDGYTLHIDRYIDFEAFRTGGQGL